MTDDRLQQPRAEVSARHQRGEVDLLVGGMGALAVGAQPVERRDAERCGEVTFAAAAGQRHIVQLLADLAIERLRLAEQLGDAGVLLVGRPVHAAGHGDLDVGADRLEAKEPVRHLLGELLAGHAQIDLGRAGRGP